MNCVSAGVVSALGVSVLCSGVVGAASVSRVADLDSYTYPFVGQRSNASEPVFAFYNDPAFVGSFDNRDGQLQFAFDTAAAGIPTGLDASDYEVFSVTLTLTCASTVGSPAWDPTLDDVSTYPIVGQPAVDPDPGRPLTLFAAAFRNGYTGFDVSGVFNPGPPLFGDSGEGYGPSSFGQNLRHVFPTDLVDDNGSPRDVSTNLDEADFGTPDYAPFNPEPLAIGQTTDVAPGAVFGFGDVFTFEIDLSEPRFRNYVIEGLQRGDLGFILATLQLASGVPGGGSGGDYPFFFLSENGASQPTLHIDYAISLDICSGDIDGDGTTSLTDFSTLAANFGLQGVADRFDGDLTGDNDVSLADFTQLANDFGCVFGQ
jgi:hypothetical protein